jgi:hypothetical protein
MQSGEKDGKNWLFGNHGKHDINKRAINSQKLVNKTDLIIAQQTTVANNCLSFPSITRITKPPGIEMAFE